MSVQHNIPTKFPFLLPTDIQCVICTLLRNLPPGGWGGRGVQWTVV